MNQGRLVQKLEKTENQTTGNWEVDNEVVYLYDGWNRIYKQTTTNQQQPTSTSYLWGLDLSGTMQGAGGVGGLLKEGGHYPAYDANGNIVQKLNSSGGTDMAVEYDPFGNIISGQLVGQYGFSTKPLIDGIDWYYYGFRYYDPVTGSWPSRDPIEERGGINLYGFVLNNPVNQIDLYGRIGVPTMDWDTDQEELTISGGDFTGTINKDGGSISVNSREGGWDNAFTRYVAGGSIEFSGFMSLTAIDENQASCNSSFTPLSGSLNGDFFEWESKSWNPFSNIWHTYSTGTVDLGDTFTVSATVGIRYGLLVRQAYTDYEGEFHGYKFWVGGNICKCMEADGWANIYSNAQANLPGVGAIAAAAILVPEAMAAISTTGGKASVLTGAFGGIAAGAAQ